MGMRSSHLHLLAMEHANHPVRGDVLTLGQQAVYGTLEDVKNIFMSHGIMPKSLKDGLDTKNKIPSWFGTPADKFTNAQAALALLGAQKVSVADISEYENPDYIIDLNYDVNEQYYDRFNVILDVGTFEHVFDIPIALSNLIKMLKKGGDIIFMVPSSNSIDHGFYSFSPTLFFDFFAANGFSNFNCYLTVGSNFNYMKKDKVYQYNWVSGEYSLTSKNNVEVCFFATKDKNADFKKINKPFQSIYRSIYYNRKKGTNALIKFLKNMEFYTRRSRPEFIDIIWRSSKRKRNTTYLGKF